jgi:hypothetical protein
MPDGVTITHDLLTRALAAYRHAGGDQEACIEAALEAALDHGAFGIGDEFTCKCGSIVGVIQSISGDDALISWACRGKFVVPIEDLLHVEHEG